MAEFIASDLRNRIRYFDTAVEATLNTLSNPQVVEGLGERAASLAFRANNLVLPNVRHGLVSLPSSASFSDRYVLLPYLTGEVGSPPRLDHSMLRPTKRRFNQTCLSLGRAAAISREFSADILLDKIADTEHLTVKCPKLNKHKGGLSTFTISHRVGPWAVDYDSRPVIYIRPDRIGYNPSETSGTVIHELTHGDDHEDLQTPQGGKPNASFRAFTEFRSYHAGWIVYNAGGVLGDQPKTVEVEALRLQHATPDNPYPVTSEIVGQLAKIISLTNKIN